MKKRLVLEIIIGFLLFSLGLLLGFHLFYKSGCSKCPSSIEGDKIVGEELIDKYSITPNAYSGIKQKGYRVDWKGTYYLLTIAMGEKKSGGYSLVVDSVTETNDGVEIIVSEEKPAMGETVTQGFTTPAITMHIPSNKVIIKTVKGTQYSLFK